MMRKLDRQEIQRLMDGETVAQQRRRLLLDSDSGEIVRCIERNPGVSSKAAIADETGLTPERVHECIRYVNANETPFHRVDYGMSRARSGRYSGQEQMGWWPMRYAVHQDVLDQADEHSARVIVGVRWSQLDRLAYAHGLTTAAGRQAASDLLARFDVLVELMSEPDFDTFAELYVEYLDGATA